MFTTPHATLRGGVFSRAFVLFIAGLVLSVLVSSSVLAFAPTSAYAEEVTGEATTEVYLVECDGSDPVPEETTTTITTTTVTDNSSSTTKTGDTIPVVPFVIAAFATAVISIVAARKLAIIGGENL